jgi:putative tryptophan/tyrosine transport system substrate-binding protein
MNPKLFWLITAILLASTHSAQAQQAKTIRIGFLTGSTSSNVNTTIEPFRQGLHDLGYIEGKHFTIDYRAADGKFERMPDLVAELIGAGVTVIVTSGMPAVIAAKKATSTIPIVAANADNLVDAGVVTSLAHPGGNVTGLSRVDADFSAKRLELLKETFPKLSRVAVLSYGSMGGDEEELREIQTAGRKLEIEIQPFPTPDPSQFSVAFDEMKKKRAGAVIFLSSSYTQVYRAKLIEFAMRNRIASMCSNATWIDSGCMLAYGPKNSEMYRRAATYVDKIVKGIKPAELPVEQPTKFEFIINLDAAKQIGLTIPPNVLARADKVIR